MQDSADERPSEREGAPARGTSPSSRRMTVVGTVLLCLGVLVAARELDVRAVAADVASADPVLLAVGVAVYAASWPIRGRRYADALAAMGHRHGTGFVTAVVFLSQTANLVLPARAGDAVRAYVLHEREVPYPAGFASLAVERLFDLLTIALLAGVALAWLAAGGGVGPLEAAGEAEGARTALLAAGGVSAATVVVTAGVVATAHSDRRFGAAVRARLEPYSRLRGVADPVFRFVADVQVVARDPRAIVTLSAGSLLVWLLDALTAVVVLLALDSGLTLGPLLAIGTLAVCVGNLAKVLPLTQGGLGLYEAAFTALVVGLTPVGASTALAAAIVDHALKNAVTLLGGAGAVAALEVSPGEAANEASAGSADTGRFLGRPKR